MGKECHGNVGTYQKARLTIAELFEHGQHHAIGLKKGGGTSNRKDDATSVFRLGLSVLGFSEL